MFDSRRLMFNSRRRFSFSMSTLTLAIASALSHAAELTEQCPLNQPVRPSQQPQVDFAHSDIRATAEETSRDDNGNTVLQGNVNFIQGTRVLSAESAQLDDINNRLHASGNIRLTDRTLVLEGRDLSADLTTSAARLNDVNYRLQDRGMRGTATQFDTDQNGVLTMSSATFTSCPLEQTTWLLSASQLQLDREEGWGEAYNMRLDLGGVPVFYLPYATFPIDDRRRSGVLLPSISNSREGGVDIAVPYYLNLADNYDATLTPRWIEKRGYQMAAEYRHAGRDSDSLLQGAYLPNDDAALPGEQQDRWAYQFQHQHQLSSRWDAMLDIAKVSDDAYFSDLGNSLDLANKNYVPRTGMLRYRDNHWQISSRLYEVQALQLADSFEPYRKLPEIVFDGFYPRQWRQVGAGLSGSLTRFDLPDVRQANRYDVAPQISVPLHGAAGFIKPQIKYRYTRYALHDVVTDEDTELTRELPIYSIDSGLFFERDLNWFSRDLVQTLEPRLYLLHVPYVDQSAIPLFDTTEPTDSYSGLFRDNRFVGADRVGDARQVSLGISTSFLTADGGEELLRFALGQARYLNTPRVGLSADSNDEQQRSPLFTEGAARLGEHWEVRQTTGLDSRSGEIQRGSFSLAYNQDERHLVNFEYRFREQLGVETEQAELSFYWPVSDRWQTVGHYAYDKVTGRTVESLFGVEYESCCWALRVAGRRYLNTRLDSEGVPLPGDDYDTGVYLQFVFKGFAAAGGAKLRDLLTERIEGFTDRLNPQ